MAKGKKKRQLRLGQITKGVLAVVAVGGMVPILAVAPGLTLAMAPFLRKKKYHSKQAVQRNIDTLIKNGLLKRVTDEKGQPSLVLTDRGKWEARIHRLDKKDKKEPTTWDGVWRVIVFDVPEHKRKVRGELRRAMTLYGFYQLQKSVWVYPHPCDDFVYLIKSHLGISNDVLYMQVTYIENDKELRREFRI